MRGQWWLDVCSFGRKPKIIIGLLCLTGGRYKTQVTGHCFINAKSILNIH